MNPLRVMIVLVAAVAAIGLAVVMQKAMGGKPAPAPVAEAAPSNKPMTQVLVAKRDLAIGDRLAAGDVAWQPWPSDAVNAAFITNGAAEPVPTKATAKAAKAVGEAAGTMIGGVTPEKAVEGAIVRDPILSGEPITARKIVRGGEGGYLSVVLGPGKRAMAVPVTSETAVGGFILPGDRVDVIQTREAQSVGEGDGASVKQTIAETIVQNVRVLALDQTTAAEKDAKTIVASTATLEVGPIEAEALTRAKAGGPVTLTLRAYTDLGGPSGLAAPSQDSAVVRINRGGQTSSISVRP
ncbi:Flp pilus assembly protein CpaB [Caulobacter sp. Root1455]|uniref:Flp pilus assembly protein CpaB n=1 Tax=unclassified Caulobacter TaxID=2648921 RepID=UPI0006F44316|nr:MULTISPECIES: Flp pilus assembly protein CpaB [unclassified Caulobacter]KQY35567.1 Flp pilus assembly protein CpaB [Caulobacter sp. Root487D2Y]KQZ06468.1 Flp pilus assembly protein CpaB [Caulobacter sp. Root1455]